MTYLVTTFYKFVALAALEAKRTTWRNFCQQRGIKGTILLASEGINQGNRILFVTKNTDKKREI